MFDFITKRFIKLLATIVNVPSHAKCTSLSNQKTLINLHLIYTLKDYITIHFQLI